MNELSKERLENYASGNWYPDADYVKAMARELLALRERAEPFGYYSPEVPTILEQQGYANISRECAGEYRLPLYTAPTAPFVPDEMPEPDTTRMFFTDAVAEIAKAQGWNACRAAMLDAAPGKEG